VPGPRQVAADHLGRDVLDCDDPELLHHRIELVQVRGV
jgi:hypothetical protein